MQQKSPPIAPPSPPREPLLTISTNGPAFSLSGPAFSLGSCGTTADDLVARKLSFQPPSNKHDALSPHAALPAPPQFNFTMSDEVSRPAGSLVFNFGASSGREARPKPSRKIALHRTSFATTRSSKAGAVKTQSSDDMSTSWVANVPPWSDSWSRLGLQADIQRVAADDPALTTLAWHGKRADNVVVNDLAEALHNNQHVRRLDLGEPLGSGKDPWAAVRKDHTMTDSGAQKLLQALPNCSVEEINLAGTGCSSELQARFKAVCLWNMVARVATDDPELTHVNWMYKHADDELVRGLAAALGTNEHVRSIDLSLNQALTDDGAAAALEDALRRPGCLIEMVTLEGTGVVSSVRTLTGWYVCVCVCVCVCVFSVASTHAHRRCFAGSLVYRVPRVRLTSSVCASTISRDDASPPTT